MTTIVRLYLSSNICSFISSPFKNKTLNKEGWYMGRRTYDIQLWYRQSQQQIRGLIIVTLDNFFKAGMLYQVVQFGAKGFELADVAK